jgi:hypothetical protein
VIQFIHRHSNDNTVEYGRSSGDSALAADAAAGHRAIACRALAPQERSVLTHTAFG